MPDASTDQSAAPRDILRRAVRQAALLRAESAAIAHAPTLDDRIGALERVREELLQFERAALIYTERTGADLLADAEQQLADLKLPSSWLEATVAQLLLCLATRVELEATLSRLASLDPTTWRALALENEHLHAARAALSESGLDAGEICELMPALLERWKSVALATFDSDELSARFLQLLDRELGRTGLRIRH